MAIFKLLFSNWWITNGEAMQWWSNLVCFSGPLITSCASDSANHQNFSYLAIFVFYVFVFCNDFCIWEYHLKGQPTIRTRKSFLHPSVISPLNLTLVRPESFHICSFFLPSGQEIPCLLPKACSRANKTRPPWSRMGVGRHWNCFPWKLRN